MAEFHDWVLADPDPEQEQVVRWRCKDLRAAVHRRFGVSVDERTIGKWLHRFEMRRLQPRPFHPKKGAAAQEAFKKLCLHCKEQRAGGGADGRNADRGLVPGRSPRGQQGTYVCNPQTSFQTVQVST